MASKTKDDMEKKLASLQTMMDGVNKKYGKGSIAFMNQKVEVDVISTGAITLDHAIGVGGIPRGRITEVYGPESSGKTTLALTVIKEVQQNGGIACFIDMEHALNPEHAFGVGVDLDKVLFSQPDSAEQAFDILKQAIQSGVIDIVVLDSVAALVTRSQISGDIGDTHVALVARLMSEALRVIGPEANRNNTAVMFINQLRQNINMTGYGAGPTEVTAGGKALKFYASLRIDIRRTEWIKKSEETIGQKVKVKIAKNKLAAPFKVVNLEIYFGEGFSNSGLLIDMALEAKIFTRSGAWFYEDGMQICQGKEKLREKINSDGKYALDLEYRVREKLELGGLPELKKKIDNYVEEDAVELGVSKEQDAPKDVEDGGFDCTILGADNADNEEGSGDE